MILSCPSCKTRYNVDAAALRGGQTVRCVKCGNSWHQDPPDDLPIVIAPELEAAGDASDTTSPDVSTDAPTDSSGDSSGDSSADSSIDASTGVSSEPPIDPATEASANASAESVDVPEVVRRRPALAPTRKTFPVAWVVLGIAVVVLLSVVIGFRDPIVTAWPPSARLYGALGLSVVPPSYGLELRELDSSQTFDGDVPMLSITGQVVNVSAEPRVVPNVRVGLTNDAGREIYHWTFVVPDRELQPGQATRFSTTLASPPEAAKHLAVTFLDE